MKSRIDAYIEHEQRGYTSIEFTVSSHDEMRVGELINFSRPDKRWWIRLWYFLTLRKGKALITESFKINSISNNQISAYKH
jgi:hypothetical protein